MKKTFVFLLGCLSCFTVQAQNSDTLPSVSVHAAYDQQLKSQPFVAQQLNTDQLKHRNVTTVADAVKFFSGVLVKDYGGLGGLKTISVRSLGAHHTAVMYDGMISSDAQNGQIDLGKWSIDHIDKITLYQGQADQLLLPARSLASASLLMLQSQELTLSEEKHAIRASMRAGSFGHWNPSLSWKLEHQKFIHRLSGEWQQSDGHYKFPSLEDGSNIKRQNTDMNAGRLEYDFHFIPNQKEAFLFKTFYTQSHRALPGAVILYNPYADDHFKEKQWIIQTSWKKHWTDKTSSWIQARYQKINSDYTDPTFNNNYGRLENNFRQREYYLTAAIEQYLGSNLNVAYAADAFVNTLNRVDIFKNNFQPVKRTSLVQSIQGKWSVSKWKMNAGGIWTNQWDKEENSSSQQLDKLNGFAGISFQPSSPLVFRFSYKQTFRTPTFNDLYYTLIGNTALKPEKASLYNFGFVFAQSQEKRIQKWMVTTDIYYNHIKDKIQAVPRQNIAQWSMLNIGKTEVYGVDLSSQVQWTIIKGWNAQLQVAYTYQQALDKSDKQSALYKLQIPYTPEHSGNAGITLEKQKWTFHYNLMFSGERYRQGEQIAENRVDGWWIHDVKLSYLNNIKTFNYTAFVEFNNIFNHHYEIIKFFPMPGFHFRIGITTQFKKLKSII